MNKYIIWRPADGISLNAGHREYLQKNGRTLKFDSNEKAVSFMKEKGLSDEFIESVNIEMEEKI